MNFSKSTAILHYYGLNVFTNLQLAKPDVYSYISEHMVNQRSVYQNVSISYTIRLFYVFAYPDKLQRNLNRLHYLIYENIFFCCPYLRISRLVIACYRWKHQSTIRYLWLHRYITRDDILMIQKQVTQTNIDLEHLFGTHYSCVVSDANIFLSRCWNVGINK